MTEETYELTETGKEVLEYWDQYESIETTFGQLRNGQIFCVPGSANGPWIKDGDDGRAVSGVGTPLICLDPNTKVTYTPGTHPDD